MNRVLSKGLENLIENYAESIGDGAPYSEEGRAFIRLLLRIKPVQEIVLETLQKLTPFLENPLAYRKKSSKSLKKIRSKEPVGVSREAQEVIDNIAQMRAHMSRIEESFEEIRDLDVPEISNELLSCLAKSEERSSKSEQLIEVLEDLSSKPPPNFLDLRDISHNEWEDHFEVERDIKKQRDKLIEKEFNLESSYFNRMFFIKEKTGRRIYKLENSLKETQENNRLNAERMLMEINDLSSALAETHNEMVDIHVDNSYKVIQDLPTAISRIEELSDTQFTLEKKVKFLEKQLRNAEHKLTITGLAHSDIYAHNNTMRYEIKYLEAALLLFIDLSNLTDSHKKKCKKYVSAKNYTKLKSRLENHEMEVSATKDILIQKINQLREGITKLIPEINDRKAYFRLFNLVEEVKLDSVSEESDKLIAKRKSEQENSKAISQKQEKPIEKEPTHKDLVSDLYYENNDLVKQLPRDDTKLKKRNTFKGRNSVSKPRLTFNVREEYKSSKINKFKTGFDKNLLKRPTVFITETLSSVDVKNKDRTPNVGSGEKIDQFIKNSFRKLAMETAPTTNMTIRNSLDNFTPSEMSPVLKEVFTRQNPRASPPRIETKNELSQTSLTCLSKYSQTTLSFNTNVQGNLITEKLGNIDIPKIHRLDPFMFKNIRTKTPSELKYFKECLSSLFNIKSNGTLVEFLETPVDNLPVHKKLLNLLKKNNVKRYEKSTQADVSSNLEELELAPMRFVKALANKNNETLKLNTERMTPKANLHLAIKSILLQTDIKIQNRGLKKANQTEIIEKVLTERMESGESDPLSQFLKQNTEENLQRCVSLIERNDIEKLGEIVQEKPKDIKTRILKKWGKLIKKSFAFRAARLGKTLQDLPLLEVWYEMGINIKYATFNQKPKEELQLSDRWIYKSASSSKNHMKFTGKNSLSITPNLPIKKLLTHSKTPETKKYTPAYFRLPLI